MNSMLSTSVLLWLALSATVYHTATATGSTPYRGTPQTIPGVMLATSYDEGGEGVGYHDETTGNEAAIATNTLGVYTARGDDVDIIAPFLSSGNGEGVIGWMSPGEWLNYAVTGAGGNFRMYFSFARSQGYDIQTYTVKFNGTTLGSINLPDTGGWATFVTKHIDVVVPSGSGTLQISVGGPGGNLHKFWFVLRSYSVTPADVQSITASSNGYGTGEFVWMQNGTPIRMGPAEFAMDTASHSLLHTKEESNPWVTITFNRSHPLQNVTFFHRTDCGAPCATRFHSGRLTIRDDSGVAVFESPVSYVTPVEVMRFANVNVVGRSVTLTLVGNNRILEVEDTKVDAGMIVATPAMLCQSIHVQCTTLSSECATIHAHDAVAGGHCDAAAAVCDSVHDDCLAKASVCAL